MVRNEQVGGRSLTLLSARDLRRLSNAAAVQRVKAALVDER